MSEINKLIESLKSSGPSMNEHGIPVGRIPNYKESWAAAFMLETYIYRLEKEKEACAKLSEAIQEYVEEVKKYWPNYMVIDSSYTKIKEATENYDKSTTYGNE